MAVEMDNNCGMETPVQPRKLVDGVHTVDELVANIKKQQFGEEGILRDWTQKTQLELLVEKEREKQEKKKDKKAKKALRKEMANEANLPAEERKKLEKMRMKQAEREEKHRAAEMRAEANRQASFL